MKITSCIKELSEYDMYIVLNDMERYGGSFVKSLVDLYRKADHINKNKLKNTFYDYFMEYYIKHINENKVIEK